MRAGRRVGFRCDQARTGRRRRAVINHDDVELGMDLRQHAFQRFVEHGLGVVRWNGDARQIVCCTRGLHDMLRRYRRCSAVALEVSPRAGLGFDSPNSCRRDARALHASLSQ